MPQYHRYGIFLKNHTIYLFQKSDGHASPEGGRGEDEMTRMNDTEENKEDQDNGLWGKPGF